jgi:beta-galactosidase/beta-glucuronidase
LDIYGWGESLARTSKAAFAEGIMAESECAEEIKMAPINETLTQDVLVPSCLESGLSGVQALNVTYSWWTRDLDIPEEWSAGGRVLLNFEAVDYEATIFINGKNVTTHTGGYWHFSVDVTEFVNPHITNKL